MSFRQGIGVTYGLLQPRHCIRIMLLPEFHFPERCQRGGIVGFMVKHVPQVPCCRVVILRIQVQQAESVVRLGVVGSKRDRPLKLRARLFGTFECGKSHAQCTMTRWIIRTYLDVMSELLACVIKFRQLQKGAPQIVKR